jgi:adenylate kinase
MIFVGGLSGSGKTHLINNLRIRNRRFRHLSCSDLLKRSGRPTQNIGRKELISNQRYLLEIIRCIADDDEQTCVIDGHAIIASRELVLIPRWFFQSLPLIKIIGVEETPSLIIERRTWSAYANTVDRISRLQRAELLRLHQISSELDIDLALVPSEYPAFERAAVS